MGITKTGTKRAPFSGEWRRNMSEALKKSGHRPPVCWGANNNKWKGGITPIREKIRHHFKYRQWRSDIFTRDNFTCVLCGVRGVYLEADHYPVMFSTICDEYTIDTVEKAINCDRLWDINNGRTLCRLCHDKTKNGKTRK